MIESPQNEKLKLVRKLRDRKQREREAVFATEGEDLLEAGLAAGARPRFVLVGAGSGLEGEEVEPALLAEVSSLGSGTRVIAVWDRPQLPPHTVDNCVAPCLYLHGVGDPGNVGTIVRTTDALLGGSIVLGPDCADPFSPKAVRASMGSIFSTPPVQAGIETTPEPRVALVAHGGEEVDTLAGAATVCLGAEREGLPEGVLARCAHKVTIPLRPDGPDSLNVAAAAAIAAQRLSSLAMREVQADA
jgi:RNA methyltransferase, TrmH family